MLTSDRLRSPLSVAATNWIARGVSAIGQVVVLPTVTRHLGIDHYAAYLVVVSLVSWYGLADLGIGAATQNRVSALRAKGLPDSEPVAAAGLLVVAVILCLLAPLLVLSPIAASKLFQGSIGDKSYGPALLELSGACFLSNTAGLVTQRVLYARAHGVIANLLLIATTLLTVLLTLGAVFAYGDDRDNLLLACVASYALPMGITGIVSALMVLQPFHRAHSRTSAEMLQLLREAVPFAFLAISGGVIYNIDVLIMSQIVSSRELSQYGVLQRILGILMSLYSAVLAANWPTWSEALIRGDSKSIIRSAATTLSAALALMSVTICAVTLTRNSIIQFFLPNSVSISAALPILFGLYLLTRMWTDTFAIILQAKGSTTVFWAIVPLQAAISMSLQILLGNRFGAPGVLAGLTIALWLTAAWAIPRTAVKQLLPSR